MRLCSTVRTVFVLALLASCVWAHAELALPYHGTASNANPLFWMTQNGLGNAGRFEIGNTTNTKGAVVGITQGTGYGVYGLTYRGAEGIHGESRAVAGIGVYGKNASSGNYGFLGSSIIGAGGFDGTTGNHGYLGVKECGVWGVAQASQNNGALGTPSYGAAGTHNASGNYGYLGSSNYGAGGFDGKTGNHGHLGVKECGVWGVAQASQNSGSLGTPFYGAFGRHNASGNYGYLGNSDYGAFGMNNATGNYGYLGDPAYGAYGKHNASGNYGYLGNSDYGAFGMNNATGNYGLLGSSNYGVWGSSDQGYGVYGFSDAWYAGYFWGKLGVTGNITKTGTCSFKIDHPLDPANKYLSHCAVESPDMRNMYDGTVMLDANGEAWVQLPDWFEALNRDFRYQLTCIGGFAPVYIAQEVSGNAFKIAGGQPGMKVSWQVTGIRQDAWANAHPYQVEEDKAENERGHYQSPEAFGQPREMGIGYIESVNSPGRPNR